MIFFETLVLILQSLCWIAGGIITLLILVINLELVYW
jgi:hypothetical protein